MDRTETFLNKYLMVIAYKKPRWYLPGAKNKWAISWSPVDKWFYTSIVQLVAYTKGTYLQDNIEIKNGFTVRIRYLHKIYYPFHPVFILFLSTVYRFILTFGNFFTGNNKIMHIINHMARINKQ